MTVLMAEVPKVAGPAVIVPCVPDKVSVIEPAEFVHRENPVAGVPARVRSWAVTDVGACQQMELAVLQGAVPLEVVP